MKKLLHIFAVVILALGLCSGAIAQQSTPLASMDFTILGIGLNVDPAYQAVPKGIASKVNTTFVSGGNTLPQSVIDQLPKDFTVRAELTGPGFQQPVNLTTRPGQGFDLPSLPILGKYTLGNIRLVDGSGTVLFGAVPQAVSVESIKDPLITSVTTRPLSLTEIRDRGVVFDNTNFTAYEFTAVLGTESKQAPITFQALIPDTHKMLDFVTAHCAQYPKC